jgi:hypothetical protein
MCSSNLTLRRHDFEVNEIIAIGRQRFDKNIFVSDEKVTKNESRYE